MYNYKMKVGRKGDTTNFNFDIFYCFHSDAVQRGNKHVTTY